MDEWDAAQFLVSERGQRALTEAAALHGDKKETLPALSRLRKAWTAEEAAAAWEMTALRDRARAKFGDDAARMLFTREALEQASGSRTAQHHAARFRETGAEAVSDLGGGIGADAIAFARAGLRVTLYERDPARALYAAWNMRALELAAVSVVTADVTASTLAPGAAWCDPARRTQGRRVASPEDYAPPLSWVAGLAERGIDLLGVKVSPAIPHSLAADIGAALEFVSDGGECKEGLLWKGLALPTDQVTATLLTRSGTHSLTGIPDSAPLPIGTGTVLYEPDAAIIRAHLVGTLGTQLGASVIDSHIAYLLAERFTPTPFASGYQVLERFAWGRKRLQERLTALNVGRVVIKKRGFPLEPDTVRGQLKLRGTEEMIVALTRCGAGHDVLLCRPLG